MLYLFLALIFLFQACSDIQSPIGPDEPDSPAAFIPGSSGSTFENPVTTVAINNYLVTFNGKAYDATSDQSTFSYTVSGTGVEPALNNFFMEIPACAGTPVAFSPVQSAKLSSSGITWEASIPTDGSQDYSITYPGDPLVGGVDARVESGNTVETVEIPGPCKGIHTISGFVFVDANENGTKDGSESGIRNVTVTLSNAAVTLHQKTSDAGAYSFSVFTGSNSVDFEVAVPSTTAATDFNEQLFETYTATTAISTTVPVNNADVTGTNFGFDPQTDKIISLFENGNFELATEEPKFWIKQLRFAKNGNDKGDVSPTELLGYLNEIEGLLLETPFQLGDNKIEEALDILTRPIKTDLEALLVQLLTAELNVVSGRGSNSPDFDLALLAFGEASAAEAAAQSAVGGVAGTAVTSTSTTTSISDAELLLTSFNSSGGGGGVGNN
ncbi:MAG: SdrD B-like domain-containing protein [Balneolaceae bacterium]|nr:SdrD B-like domain-containing protein [Balneolaceae bacterium]